MSSDLVSAILSSLKESGIIPDVIPHSLDFTPSEFFTVAYPSKTLEQVGTQFTKEETQEEPELYLIDNDEGEAAAEETYTLVLTDPDAPSRADPKYGQWRHWVVPGLKIQNGSKGPAALEKTRSSLTPYLGPSPPPGSGPHRYVFLLFEEPTPDYTVIGTAVEHNGEFTSRRHWNALKFADDAMSTPIPNPVLAITTLLQDSGVVPDVIPAALGFRPSIFFSPVYPKTDANAVLGTRLSKQHTQEEPGLRIVRSEDDEIDEASKDKSYTLVLTDPDAPSRGDPKFAQWRHWVITGLKVPYEPGTGTIQKTKPSSTPYYGPAPPSGTGLHRYVFLLFEEPRSFKLPHDAVENNGDVKSRAKWNALKFADQYGLRLVGVNYFLTEHA